MAQGFAGSCISGVLNVSRRAGCVLARKVDIRLPEKKEFRLTWHEAGPPNYLDDKVDSDQKVVNKERSLCLGRIYRGQHVLPPRPHGPSPAVYYPSFVDSEPSILPILSFSSRLFPIFCLFRAVYSHSAVYSEPSIPPLPSIPRRLFLLFRAVYSPSFVPGLRSQPSTPRVLYQGF